MFTLRLHISSRYIYNAWHHLHKLFYLRTQVRSVRSGLPQIHLIGYLYYELN